MRKRILIFVFSALLFGAWAHAETAFGDAGVGDAALIGILYDLKQTQAGEPSDVDLTNYPRRIADFLESDWDERLLNRYFRVSRPVYSTRIYIPTMPAEQAPRAFGVESIVDPQLWVVHYKGQVRAPAAGVYRFAGFADDIIAVRLNGDLVLVAGYPDCIPSDFEWTPSGPPGLPIAHGATTHGDWFAADEGEVFDLDVLVGERPGGLFGAWLFIEVRGESYPQQGGHRLLPVFQLSDAPLGHNNVPAAPASVFSVWSALQ